MTPEEFIRHLGTDKIEHVSGDIFSDHLQGVQGVLQHWHADPEVALAGLLHSIYGTEGFQDFQLSLDRREDVKNVIGERAEKIAYVNCVLDRLSLDSQLDAAPGQHSVRARPEVGGHQIPLTDQEHTDLITVHLADWLEQVEREAQKAEERHGWEKPGDAWGYRRGAYRRMAEILQGPAIKMYDEVFGREPAHTRHIHQKLTKKLDKPIVPKMMIN